MKRLHFRDRVKQKLRPLAFAALGFGVLSGCPSVKIVKEPLKSFAQNKTPKHEATTTKGTWKDGECWIDGRDTIVYSYRVGENKIETKRYRTERFLEENERIKEIRCSEKYTYVLTNAHFIVLEGASTTYFGKNQITLISKVIELGNLNGRIIDWVPQEKEAFILTGNSIEYITYNEKGKDRRIMGEFDEKTRMHFYKGFLFVVRPGKETFLTIYKPGDQKSKNYDANPAYVGHVRFIEKDNGLNILIGKENIEIKVEEGKVIF